MLCKALPQWMGAGALKRPAHRSTAAGGRETGAPALLDTASSGSRSHHVVLLATQNATRWLRNFVSVRGYAGYAASVSVRMAENQSVRADPCKSGCKAQNRVEMPCL